MQVATCGLLTVLSLLCVVLSACTAPTAKGEGALSSPTAIAAATQSPTATTMIVPESTITPSPTASAFTLGEPASIGRGEIIGALFLSGGTLVIGWADGLSVVELPSGEERWWQPAGAAVIAVDVSPRGHAIAAALASGEVLILDMASGSVHRFDGAAPHATGGDISWSPDGERIAFQLSGPGRHDPISVLEVARGTIQTVPNSQLPEGHFPSLSWTPDNEAITLAAYGEGCSRVLEIETGESRFPLEYDGECYNPFAMARSTDGRHLALVGEPGVVLVDSESHQIVQRLEGASLGSTMVRGNFTNSGPPLLFSPDGRYIASKGGISLDESVVPLVVWEVESGERVAQLGEPGNAYDLGIPDHDRLAIGFEGETLLSLYEDGSITQFSFTAEAPVERIIHRIPVVVPQPLFAWSADETRLTARNRYRGASVWDVATGNEIARFEAPLDFPSLSPDGTLLALTDPDAKQLHIYDIASGEQIQRLPDATFPAQSSSPYFMTTLFSPDGLKIAYPSHNRVIVADVATGRQVAELGGFPDDQGIVQVTWAPDGGALVATTATPLESPAATSLILWERTEDGTFRQSFQKATQAGNSSRTLVRFSPSGKIAALQYTSVANGPSHIALYDRAAGEVILTLENHQLLSFLSEDRLLTGTSDQGRARFVELSIVTGEQKAFPRDQRRDELFMPRSHYFVREKMSLDAPTPPATNFLAFEIYRRRQLIAEGYHGSELSHFSWSPAGRWLLSLAWDGTLKRWPVLINEN